MIEDVTEYSIVAATNEDQLTQKVTSAIAQGWQPEGDIVVGGNYGESYQKMVKRESAAAEILDFYTWELGQTGQATIDEENSTVDVEVPLLSSLANVQFGIVLSPNAVADLASPQTFTDGVAKVFTVTAENGTQRLWSITLTIGL